jgi:PAS domain S-box-containing protein
MSSRTVITLDNISDAAILTDPENRIVGWNPGAERLFGYACAEATGQNAEMLYGPSQASLIASWPCTDRRTGETRFVRKDGTEGVCEIATLPLHDPQGRPLATMAVYRDITERKRAEQYQAARDAVRRVLAGSESLAEASHSLLWAISEALDWLWAALWLPDPRAGVLRCHHIWQASNFRPSGFRRASQQARFAPAADMPGRVWAHRECISIPDLAIAKPTPRLSAAIQVGLRSAAYFPVLTEGPDGGVIELFGRPTRPDNDALLECVQALGRQLGQFVDQKQAAATSLAPRPATG